MTKRICIVADCQGQHWAKDFCRKHYKRWKRNGTPELNSQSLTEIFWSHVDRRGSDECWPWTAATLKGYGRGRTAAHGYYYAHRLSYEFAHGPIGADAVVRHRCDNPPCVNPAHLELGSQADNVQDMVERGRGHWQKKSACKRGHRYTPENTYLRAGGGRTCRTCVAASRARRKHPQAAYDIGISERRNAA